MASTILSNTIEPKVFTAYANQLTTVKSALLSSGVLARSAEFDVRASQKGSVGELPHFNPFAWSESNVASDDPSVKSVPANITTGSQIFRTDFREKDWGAMDLVSRVIGEDVMGAIGGIVSQFWVQEYQQHVLARLKSIELDNAANDGGDMIVNVATDATGAPTAAQSVNVGTLLDAAQTMGDSSSAIGVYVMHSQIFTNLMKSEPGSFAAPSTTVPFVTYLGKRVIVDDTCPVVQGTNRKTYTTYLLAPGAFAMGEASLENATETWRDPAAGNGFAEERLYSRKQFMIHAVGFTAAGAAVTARSKSPTLAQWSAATAHDRVFDRKNIPIAILKTNA